MFEDKVSDEEKIILDEDMVVEYDVNTSITSNSTVLSATDSVITANSCVLFINADTTIKDQIKKYQPKVPEISSIASIFLMVCKSDNFWFFFQIIRSNFNQTFFVL